MDMDMDMDMGTGEELRGEIEEVHGYHLLLLVLSSRKYG
jgi:hypothetical protein